MYSWQRNTKMLFNKLLYCRTEEKKHLRRGLMIKVNNKGDSCIRYINKLTTAKK